MTKAQTRAGKRRRKGGRPRIDGALRTADGTISEGSAEIVRRAETMTETATEARQRVFGMSAEEAKSQEAGSVLGRLYLDGKLGPVLKKQGTSYYRLEAGNRYAEDINSYYRLTGYPHPNGKAQNILSVRGYDGDPTDEDTRRGLRITDRVMNLEKCLRDVDKGFNGRPATSCIRDVCVRELDTARGWTVFQLRHLVRGLDALVEFYGIGATK